MAQTYTYTFKPTSSLTTSMLLAKSTVMKVNYTPVDFFVDATVIAPSTLSPLPRDLDSKKEEEEAGEERGEKGWKVVVRKLPNRKPHLEEQATLYAYKGEAGKVLGSIRLGDARGCL